MSDELKKPGGKRWAVIGGIVVRLAGFGLANSVTYAPDASNASIRTAGDADRGVGCGMRIIGRADHFRSQLACQSAEVTA